MGRSPMLDTVAIILLPFLVLFALHLVISGHSEPGGGFIGGVLLVAAVLLQAIARPMGKLERPLRTGFLLGIVVGLLLMMSVGLVGLFKGLPYLTSLHTRLEFAPLNILVELSLSLIFDVGVFLLVAGALLTAAFAFGED